MSLPEEFAPTGPKLSRFPIRPPPPLRPRLFPDEARFALRLAVLAGATELLGWLYLAMALPDRAVLALGVLRCLKPLWARLGTRMPRPAVASLLLGGAALAMAAALLESRLRQPTDLWNRLDTILWAVAIAAAGLPALGDLCATCIGDSVTVERRAAAFAWLDMAQAIGAMLGIAAVPFFRSAESFEIPGQLYAAWAAAIVLACVGIPALRDRGTPRSAWPAGAYFSVLRSPLLRSLAPLALAVGALALGSLHSPFRPHFSAAIPRWLQAVAPLAGMAAAARLERHVPNSIWLPRAALACAAVGWFLAAWPLALFALGMMFTAVPAAVARGAGEMERPIASSLAWSALLLGAAVGAAL